MAGLFGGGGGGPSFDERLQAQRDQVAQAQAANAAKSEAAAQTAQFQQQQQQEQLANAAALKQQQANVPKTATGAFFGAAAGAPNSLLNPGSGARGKFLGGSA